ncbi:ABC transporter substrate-binding protein [Cohnella fermenti]|uniref:Peptide ABC transporter substrate-binding protein n=1 Tax=Cohnella fermenti TaxID=2565925 RepID=A0A4S4BN99_9BACL|nr:ABC transporter substrate-binding protein [Cohnella fermenti]THF75752.1 peptide ABC transporter substrate-binding protein [Cohnella fermenti]
MKRVRESKGWISIVLVLILLATGCSSNGSNGSSGQGAEGTDGGSPAAASTSASESASAVKATSVEELKIGVAADSGPLNLYTTSDDYLLDLVFDKLFGPSPYVDEPQPLLAESAEQLDDFTWTLKVRDGVKWHDGTPFTADDVKFTFEYYRDGPQNRFSHHVSEVPKIGTIEKLDDTTLKFTCEYACPSLKTVTFADLPILAKHIWENVENPRKFTDLAIGTGPYKLVEYVPDQYYRFEANEDYFLGKPTVSKITMPIIKDQTAMFNALRAGEIDVSAKSVPSELLANIEDGGKLKVKRTAELAIVEVKLNYDKEPFVNESFRNALSLSIDRQTITDTVLLGHARAGVTGYPHPDSPWTNPNLSTPYDVEAARAVLDGIGYKDTNGDGLREDPNGQPLKIKLAVSSAEPTYIRTSELLKEQFANTGIDVAVEVLDPSAITAISSERTFDMIIGMIGAHGVGDPDQFVMSHYAGYLWKKDVPYPAMDTLIEQWKQETTIEGRKLISFQMQELFNKQPTSLTVYYPEQNWAYNPDKFADWVETPGYGMIHKYSFLGEIGKQYATNNA